MNFNALREIFRNVEEMAGELEYVQDRLQTAYNNLDNATKELQDLRNSIASGPQQVGYSLAQIQLALKAVRDNPTNIISAIKLVRGETTLGLREAKDLCDFVRTVVLAK